MCFPTYLAVIVDHGRVEQALCDVEGDKNRKHILYEKDTAWLDQLK